MDATLDRRQARRLALARAGLLKPEWTALPARAAGRGRRAREGAQRVISHFGYLQLDTLSVAGARTHGIVLASRLAGFDPAIAEELLVPGAPLFEYWGHEKCWLPLELYPCFAFRRQEFRVDPWWGDLLGEHPEVARRVLERIRQEGPLRSADLDDGSRKVGDDMWALQLVKKVISALWSAGELAVRERRHFHRIWDLTERVIPSPWREREVPFDEALKTLLLKALDGHGWAMTGTLAATWRLRNCQGAIATALAELQEAGEIVPCTLVAGELEKVGWIRPADLELAARLERVRPRPDRGVLLSPFDPVLWDRPRVRQLFGFEQVIEIYKPAAERVYGYYCLPVLAGDALVARVDLKADRRRGRLQVLAYHAEDGARSPRAATLDALRRYADALGLEPVLPRGLNAPNPRSA